MKINIRGKDWTIELHTEEDFNDKHEGCTAITETTDRIINFHNGDLTLQTIIHELIHAYHAAGYTNSADLTLDQQEEIFAELFSEFGIQIIKDARKMRKILKEMAEDLE